MKVELMVNKARHCGKTQACIEIIKEHGGAHVPCYSRKHSLYILLLLKRHFPDWEIKRDYQYHDWDYKPAELSYFVNIYRQAPPPQLNKEMDK